MSLLTPVIGAYWPARREEKEACICRTLTMLEGLERETQQLVWFPTASRPKPLKPPIELNTPSISRLFTTNNRDVDRQPIPELGFYLSMWNGNSRQAIGLSITCGAYSLRQTNCVVINLPPAANPAPELIDDYGKWLRLVVEAWEPDFAVATTMQAIAKFAPVTARSIIGWFVYRQGGPIERTPFAPGGRVQ